VIVAPPIHDQAQVYLLAYLLVPTSMCVYGWLFGFRVAVAVTCGRSLSWIIIVFTVLGVVAVLFRNLDELERRRCPYNCYIRWLIASVEIIADDGTVRAPAVT